MRSGWFRRLCENLLILAVSAVAGLTYAHSNFVEPFNRPAYPLGQKIARTYRSVFNNIVNVGYALRIGTKWRMFTPPWKDTRWQTWYGIDREGKAHLLRTMSFGPGYRQNRSWAEALFLDYKEPATQMVLHWHAMVRSDKESCAYSVARTHCQLLPNGQFTEAIRLVFEGKDIPPASAAVDPEVGPATFSYPYKKDFPCF